MGFLTLPSVHVSILPAKSNFFSDNSSMFLVLILSFQALVPPEAFKVEDSEYITCEKIDVSSQLFGRVST